MFRFLLSLVSLLAASASVHSAVKQPPEAGASESPALEGWKEADIREVSQTASLHTIHSYFGINPESPDGKHVLLYTSATENGEQGEVRIIERATGKETVVASDIITEDAHRAACQQWINGGKHIVFHNYRDGRWQVVAVDTKTLEQKVLAEDRQLGFPSPTGVWVPVYGRHWNPGPHRDLELIHVLTGEVRKPVTAEQVVREYGDYVQERFDSTDISICFPTMSPDEKRVFFKLSRPGGGDDFRSKQASLRDGKVVFDLETERLVKLMPKWGHPAWHPDSRRILEKGYHLIDAEKGTVTQVASTPDGSLPVPSNHPSLSPDGELFVSDADVSRRDWAKPGDWVVVVGPVEGEGFVVVHQFNNTHGARSWRKNHPHPAFSADGRRLYYNVNEGPWTRLHVAERK